jgi:uncharacterized protein YbcI
MVNQGIYAIGVSQQRIDIFGDKILICAVHRRIPALKALDKPNRALTKMVDAALIELNKQELARRVEDIVGIKIRAILKDYDPYTEMAATVIIFEEPLEE